ncbi:YidC/Oxa1 family membrane protein insertase [Austwickia chelonae]|uniref:Membrane protein insertase YidC n=1 Tax=Austwickia chelonae NBRC 105200 TaxID=1184607 RepID=K6VUS3_9MICO|nr:membrane protein insertase YidC [Austwickia chelonae]GAB79065.1 OxaA family protein [Austwickia chelonae NBRC 105200]SEW42003.1 YidC/Oxa1 family membrane protein insertase [Austwickia chelonae]
MSWYDQMLWPLRWAVEWILVGFHTLFTSIGAPAASGWTWSASIAGLVVLVRVLLIPLFVKQIESSRRMQLIQPEVQKIQARYKGKTDPDSVRARNEETMALYKRTGTNPFSSCMPILLQMPIFFALFSVLNNLGRVADPQSGVHAAGPLTAALAKQADNSTIFGAPLSSTFLYSGSTEAKILTVVLIILMSVTTFWTQHQLMRKNMPASALDNPFAQQQKILLYLMPIIFAVSGINFPIGVLIYWLVTNLWTAGQQYYVIKRMPAPGSQAEKDLAERRRRAGKEHKVFSLPGLQSGAAEEGPESPVQDNLKKLSGQRQQPVRRKKKR